MTKQQAENYSRLVTRLSGLGFTYTEIQSLIRIERTLQRWSELECGDGNDWASWAIERDEKTEKPFIVRHNYRHGNGKDTVTKTPIADRESGALRRLAKIMATRPHLLAYHQGDPRGCALYVVPASEVKPCEDISSVYTRGVAVCY